MKIRHFLIFVLLAAGLAACTTASRPELSGMSFAAEPLTGKVVWYDLITEDLDSARDFYQGLFGWTFEDAKGPRGQDYAVARSGNVYVAGMVEIAAATDGRKLSRWLPYVSVADVDEAVSRGVDAGASVAVSARDVNLGRVAALVDPEGAVIGLARSAYGDPDETTTAPAAGRPVWTELLADDADANTSLNFELDAVSIATGHMGQPTPEPATMLMLAVGAVGVCRRRRK